MKSLSFSGVLHGAIFFPVFSSKHHMYTYIIYSTLSVTLLIRTAVIHIVLQYYRHNFYNNYAFL